MLYVVVTGSMAALKAGGEAGVNGCVAARMVQHVMYRRHVHMPWLCVWSPGAHSTWVPDTEPCHVGGHRRMAWLSTPLQPS
jgi:hypothetical protein